MNSGLVLYYFLINIDDGEMEKNVKEERSSWVPTGLCSHCVTGLFIPLSLKVLISKIYWSFYDMLHMKWHMVLM